jgi:hypothetical protein
VKLEVVLKTALMLMLMLHHMHLMEAMFRLALQILKVINKLNAILTRLHQGETKFVYSRYNCYFFRAGITFRERKERSFG